MKFPLWRRDPISKKSKVVFFIQSSNQKFGEYRISTSRFLVGFWKIIHIQVTFPFLFLILNYLSYLNKILYTQRT